MATCSKKDLANVAAGTSPGVIFVVCMYISADPASNPDREISCYIKSGYGEGVGGGSLQVLLYAQINGWAHIQIQYFALSS